jgi:hypothetical protein
MGRGIRVAGLVKSSDLVVMVGISGPAALIGLAAMVEKDFLKREGDWRGVRYILQ